MIAKRHDGRKYKQRKDVYRAWYKRTVEARRAYGRKYWAEHKKQKQIYDKARRQENKRKYFMQKIKRSYRITAEEFDLMLSRSYGRCDICYKCFSGREPFIDHDHSSGNVRGLLCSKCNFSVGLLDDNPEIVDRLYRYLNEYKQKIKALQ